MGRGKEFIPLKTCFLKIVIRAKSLPGVLPEAAPWAGIRVRAAAPSGEGRSGLHSRGALSPARPGECWGAPHCQAPAGPAIRAGRGGLWRLTDYTVERTTWKWVPPPSISSSSWNPSSWRSRASFRRVQGRGNRFSSQKDQAGRDHLGQGDGQLLRKCTHKPVPEVPDPAAQPRWFREWTPVPQRWPHAGWSRRS